MSNDNGSPNIIVLNEEDDGTGRQIRSTDFVLTINTNQLVTQDMDAVNADEYDNRLQEVVDTIRDMFRNLMGIHNDNWGPVNWLDFPGDDGVDNIVQPINVTYSFERIPEDKPNAGRFHVHVLVQIRHNSNIDVATGRLIALIKQYLQRIDIIPYVYMRFARSAFNAIIRYMRKDLIEGRNAVRYDYNWRQRRNNNVPAPRNNNYIDYDTEDEDSVSF